MDEAIKTLKIFEDDDDDGWSDCGLDMLEYNGYDKIRYSDSDDAPATHIAIPDATSKKVTFY